ncbi:expressed unknown protein [Seminavis robusta]|uniref:Uncharacterized protein n=1 Tax=Seminavis robusta TaxID=568900 RepID=A0A9N8HF97_9STRA|nr:expressed unknown protein [Seminavis robusta]|eukprot:Sro339_g121050.1 n/a (938) ;mRNA; f:35513-38326
MMSAFTSLVLPLFLALIDHRSTGTPPTRVMNRSMTSSKSLFVVFLCAMATSSRVSATPNAVIGKPIMMSQRNTLLRVKVSVQLEALLPKDDIGVEYWFLREEDNFNISQVAAAIDERRAYIVTVDELRPVQEREDNVDESSSSSRMIDTIDDDTIPEKYLSLPWEAASTTNKGSPVFNGDVSLSYLLPFRDGSSTTRTLLVSLWEDKPLGETDLHWKPPTMLARRLVNIPSGTQTVASRHPTAIIQRSFVEIELEAKTSIVWPVEKSRGKQLRDQQGNSWWLCPAGAVLLVMLVMHRSGGLKDSTVKPDTLVHEGESNDDNESCIDPAAEMAIEGAYDGCDNPHHSILSSAPFNEHASISANKTTNEIRSLNSPRDVPAEDRRQRDWETHVLPNSQGHRQFLQQQHIRFNNPRQHQLQPLGTAAVHSNQHVASPKILSPQQALTIDTNATLRLPPRPLQSAKQTINSTPKEPTEETGAIHDPVQQETPLIFDAVMAAQMQTPVDRHSFVQSHDNMLTYSDDGQKNIDAGTALANDETIASFNGGVYKAEPVMQTQSYEANGSKETQYETDTAQIAQTVHQDQQSDATYTCCKGTEATTAPKDAIIRKDEGRDSPMASREAAGSAKENSTREQRTAESTVANRKFQQPGDAGMTTPQQTNRLSSQRVAPQLEAGDCNIAENDGNNACAIASATPKRLNLSPPMQKSTRGDNWLKRLKNRASIAASSRTSTEVASSVGSEQVSYDSTLVPYSDASVDRPDLGPCNRRNTKSSRQFASYQRSRGEAGEPYKLGVKKKARSKNSSRARQRGSATRTKGGKCKGNEVACLSQSPSVIVVEPSQRTPPDRKGRRVTLSVEGSRKRSSPASTVPSVEAGEGRSVDTSTASAKARKRRRNRYSNADGIAQALTGIRPSTSLAHAAQEITAPVWSLEASKDEDIGA